MATDTLADIRKSLAGTGKRIVVAQPILGTAGSRRLRNAVGQRKQIGVASHERHESRMRKIEDYKNHAHDCRAMARISTNEEHRQGLIQMAEIWESLAADRIAQTMRQQRIKVLDAEQ